MYKYIILSLLSVGLLFINKDLLYKNETELEIQENINDEMIYQEIHYLEEYDESSSECSEILINYTYDDIF